MTRFPIAIFVALALVGAARAQSPVEVARAQSGASCPKCNLFQADLSNKELKSKNFSGARLRQASMAAAVMNRTTFAGADLRDVDAYGAVFSSANFAGANLTNATLVGAYLQGSNFAGATLDGTNFSGAEMSKARGLRQAQLSAACGDSSTTLPPGLRLQPCR